MNGRLSGCVLDRKDDVHHEAAACGRLSARKKRLRIAAGGGPCSWMGALLLSG